MTPQPAAAVGSPGVADPYSIDNIPSPVSRPMRTPATAKPTTQAPASPLSGMSLSHNAASTRKRQRAFSEGVDHAHARKRGVPPPSSLRAQSVTVKTKMRDAASAPTSQPSPTASSKTPDAALNEGSHHAGSRLKTSSVPASRNGDSTVQATASLRRSGGSSILSPDTERPEGPASPDRARSATKLQVGDTARITQSTQTDDEFHDALDDNNDVTTPLSQNVATIHATSDRSITVSSRKDGSTRHNMFVSELGEHVLHAQFTPAKRTRGKADHAQGRDKTPGRSFRVGRRDAVKDTTKANIDVSEERDEGEQTIHAKAKATDKSINTEEGAADDREYEVSHIQAHRIAPESNAVELLVHWKESTPGDNAPTWELEENLQESALDAVVDYWATIKGGRVAARPYEVYAITGHKWLKKGRSKKKSLYLEVEWVGYKEKSVEPLRRLSQDQPELVAEYFNSIGGRPQPPH